MGGWMGWVRRVFGGDFDICRGECPGIPTLKLPHSLLNDLAGKQ